MTPETLSDTPAQIVGELEEAKDEIWRAMRHLESEPSLASYEVAQMAIDEAHRRLWKAESLIREAKRK